MSELWRAPHILRDSSDTVSALVKLEDWFRRVSGLYIQPRTSAVATTLLVSDRLLLMDTSGGARTVTLLSAKEYPPQPYAVKLLAGANNVTLDADGTELIYTTAGAGTLVWNVTGATKVIVPFQTSTPGTWAWAEIGT